MFEVKWIVLFQNIIYRCEWRNESWSYYLINPADSVSDPECKFNMCDQPPGDIDLIMAIKVQLLIIPMDHTPPMFVTVGALILPIPKNDQY